ncbi:MAG: PAS domain-containing protein [Sedimentisphaerales bacterium]|nr:PAS domain-containing protein [Sedimentisphaerales bacterium]
MMLAAIPLGGAKLPESLVCVAAIGAAGWLARRLFIEGKMLFARIASLENDHRKYVEKTSQSVKDAKDLKLQLQILKRQKRNTEAIIYSISDAVIVTDASDKLVMANEPAGNLLGFKVEQSVLKPIDGLIQNEELINLIKTSRGSKVRHVRHELQFNTGEDQLTYDGIISSIYDDDGQVCGTVSVLHNITREKEISQMKNDFVSHVSHELKTPLASITAYSEMLVDGEANDEKTRREFYSVIQNQAQRLNRLIEDILNISRIESGLIKVNKEAVSTALIIRDAVQMIKSYAAEKNIEVEDRTSVVFDQVNADKDMISQVVINLLSNAVKYTPENGKITVNSEVDESKCVVRVAVTDTGVGIPPEELPNVFEKFYRVKANTKFAKGTGLGLNLVKQIVENIHGGQVFVTSEVGKGSCFSLELPLLTEEKTVAR